MAGLPVLKKGGKFQNDVSSSDFEIFSPEMHALIFTCAILALLVIFKPNDAFRNGPKPFGR